MLPRQSQTVEPMKSAQRPREVRWLKGVILGVVLLLLALILLVVEWQVCELSRMAKLSCSTVPQSTYQVMCIAAAVCFVHGIYRAYRDFVRGDLERDLEVWSGRYGQPPRQAGARPDQEAVQVPMTTGADEQPEQVTEEIEAMLAEYSRSNQEGGEPR